MKITFLDGINAWEDFNKNVHTLITDNSFKKVAEIGGGANPLLSIDFIKNRQVKYDVIDVSAEELSKAPDFYEKKIIDMENPFLSLSAQYDFVFAQMTLEHIKNPEQFFSNIRQLLRKGGQAYLFYACVTSLPFIVNHLIPEGLSNRILLRLQPFRKDEKHGKFKAYYKWCYGPTHKNIRRIQGAGLRIIIYAGYFGHSYYQRFPLLNRLENLKKKFLLKNPIAYMCSYAHVLLEK